MTRRLRERADPEARIVPGVVDLWLVELERFRGRLEWLDETERRRARRFKVEGAARQLVRSHTALRSILSLYLGLSPARVQLVAAEKGKPLVLGGGLEFNLSHSGSVAVIGVMASGRLGVDVEGRVDLPHGELVRRFFSAAEVAEYLGLSAERRKRAFYRGWTRKESYLKAWGTGLSFSSRRFSLSLAPGGGRILRSTEMPGDHPARWSFADRDLGGYQIAACWEGEGRLRVRRFDPALMLPT